MSMKYETIGLDLVKLGVCIFAASVMVNCGNAKSHNQSPQAQFSTANKSEEDTMATSEKFTFTSTAFKEGEMIPQKYTCDGQNISPPLKWGSASAQTKSFALIVDDPDAPAGIWVHWVIFNIPPATTGLPENVPTIDSLPDGSMQGKNDSREIGYDGPCPPGGTHRYYFKLYALDTMLKLSSGSTKTDLLKAMEGHIVAQVQLMGRYSRK
jgi:Raf kinase inhibitor-like YbhB/YbcL family protein